MHLQLPSSRSPKLGLRMEISEDWKTSVPGRRIPGDRQEARESAYYHVLGRDNARLRSYSSRCTYVMLIRAVGSDPVLLVILYYVQPAS